uniref:Uncharacterized protein n=1 Tax=Anguilla anguilla TaxID=7936 RepID=A0A0E9PNL2_ANGAN
MTHPLTNHTPVSWCTFYSPWSFGSLKQKEVG